MLSTGWIGDRRRRRSARRVYEELLRGIAWARRPAGPLPDGAWAAHRRRFEVGRDLYERVDWAYDTLRDAGPAPPSPPGYAAARQRLARAHPELFGDRPPPAGWNAGVAAAEADVWFWIGRAVPDGLAAAGAEAGLGAARVNRDLAEAIVGT